MDTTTELKRRRFTLEEYHRMGEVGIFHEDDRVELIEGEIVEMSPIGRVHAGTVDRIAHMFSQRLRERAIVRVQNPIVFPQLVSEPQPDLTLLVPRADFYTSGHPGPEDILLVVEVMDSTVAYDRGIKLRLYARAGVVEVWLADVNTRRIEQYRRVSTDGYGESRVLEGSDPVVVQAFDETVFTVRELLG
jgi:Uma2 family endonuclease